MVWSISLNQIQFDVVNEVQVYKQLKEINPERATGPDDIPPKLVKLG